MGGNVCNGWHAQVVNPNSGSHDMRLADFDGDGKMDLLASGQQIPSNRLSGFMSFQNSYNAWVLERFAPPSGDGITLVAVTGVNGGARTNVVACNPSNNSLYWYQNPGGAAARTANWTAHLIASSSTGESRLYCRGVSGHFKCWQQRHNYRRDQQKGHE